MTLMAAGPRPTGTGEQGRSLPPSMVERMTLILDAFRTPGDRLTLEQVARETALPRSTAHRILDQLVRLQWLDHSASGYALGRRSLGLGGQGAAHSELRSAAAAHLHELHLRTGLVVHLAVLEGSDVQYLDKVGGLRARSVPSRVGGRAPAHRTALGRAILAWHDAEDVDALVGARVVAEPADGVRTAAALHRELHKIRGRHGLAFEQEECFADIACVAAAIRSPEGALAAISLVGDSGTPLTRVAPLVVDAARAVSHELYPDTTGRRRVAS